jgi:hypothetical protein
MGEPNKIRDYVMSSKCLTEWREILRQFTETYQLHFFLSHAFYIRGYHLCDSTGLYLSVRRVIIFIRLMTQAHVVIFTVAIVSFTRVKDTLNLHNETESEKFN